MILYLEYGTGTAGIHLDLVGSDISCENFDPGVFENPAQPITQATAKLSIHGKTTLTAATSAIGRLQIQIQTNVGRNLGAHVYLWYSPTNDKNLYRSRVYALNFAPENSASYFITGNRHMPATMVIAHGIWQGELTQIPLTNSHTTDDLAGLQIENTFAGTRDNTALINDEDVIGDLPSPIRLEITNTTAAISVAQYWVSNNVNSTPASLTFCLEGESATPLSNVAQAIYSNGNANQISIASTVENDMLTWAISSAQASYMASNQFHLMIKTGALAALSGSALFRFKIEKSATSYVLWRGDMVSFPGAGPALGTGDYGVIRLPPWRLDTGASSSGFDLIMSAAQITAGAAIPIQIDAIYLFPVDSFRNIKTYFLATNQRLVDDMIENDLWMDTGAGTARIGAAVGLGGALMVYPGANQKLYFLSNHTGGDSAETTSTVKVYYRPLRLAL